MKEYLFLKNKPDYVPDSTKPVRKSDNRTSPYIRQTKHRIRPATARPSRPQTARQDNQFIRNVPRFNEALPSNPLVQTDVKNVL